MRASMRKVLGLAIASILCTPAAHAACSDSPEQARNAPLRTIANAANAANAAQRAGRPNSADRDLARLARLLRRSQLGMPVLATENHANEMSVAIRLIDLQPDSRGNRSRDRAAQKTAAIAASIPHYDYNDTGRETLDTLRASDIHVTLRSDASLAAIRRAILEVVPTEQRAEVEALLRSRSLVGSHQRLQIYDTQAEVIGTDSILIAPAGATKALLIQIDYVHA